MTDELEARRRFSQARALVLSREPYWAHILTALVYVAKPGLGSVAITKKLHLLYDPEAVLHDPELGKLDQGLPHVLAGALVHECQHIARGFERVAALAEISHKLANLSADLAINPDVIRAGWRLPAWAVMPSQYGLPDGKTMEWYFEQLKNQAGDGGDAASGHVCSGNCGSGVGGKEVEVDDPGRTSGEVMEVQSATVQAAKQHFSDSPGTKPGWVEEAVADRPKEPMPDWRRVLERVAKVATGAVSGGGSDFSMARPHRRSLQRGIMLPGLVDQELEVALSIDTSGSMSGHDLAQARQVVLGVLKQLGIQDVWLALHDCTVQSQFERVVVRDVSMRVKGRGGTDFRPIFTALERLRPRPNVFVAITDGDGPVPEVRPRIPTVWAIIPNTCARVPARWGRAVVCSNNPGVVRRILDRAK